MIVNTLKNELKQHKLFKFDDVVLSEIRNKDGIYVYRVKTTNEQYVIKYFEKEEYRRELEYYKLLKKLDIPTIPVISITDRSIILEDISVSTRYRLGVEADLENEKVAIGLVEWYTNFHEMGELFLKENPDQLANMYNEYKEISQDTIVDLMNRSGTEKHEYWNVLIEHFDKIRSLNERHTNTLTYNDFYFTNLIVSNDESEVIMFDYNFIGCGFRASDVRNITASLKGKAKHVFLKHYPQCQEAEVVLDDVLSTLFALKEAYKRSTFPAWAREFREDLNNGVFEKKVLQLMKYLV